MNSFGFRSSSGPILVEAEMTGPSGTVGPTLLLDTGATRSLIHSDFLIARGFDPDQSSQRVSMTTGSGQEVVPLVVLTRLSGLGQHRFGFPVIAHALPTSIAVDGLLGLDFLRDLTLTVEFRSGQISLI